METSNNQTVLVLNCGSSSLKFAIINPNSGQQYLSGLAEALTLPEAQISWRFGDDGDKQKAALPAGADHTAALTFLEEEVLHGQQALLDSLVAVGHRVVNGGEYFSEPTLVTDEVEAIIEKCIPLAPIHNPAHLLGIRAARRLFASLPHVLVFDTAFHQTMPAKAYMYGLPYEMYTKYGVRRYGFHGTSHAYVSERGSELAGSFKQGGWLTAHLGNGSSTCAIWNGQSVDTSMGLTPLEGVVMGTRSGDVDPSIHSFLASNLGWDIYKIDKMLNSQSGLLGLSDLSNDMRTLIEASDQGNEDAALAIEVFCYRLAKSLAALSCGLPRIDGLFFTGGIGENSALIREKTLAYLPHFGFNLSKDKNDSLKRGTEGRIDAGAGPQIWVVPTDEEGRIAKETQHVVEEAASAKKSEAEEEAVA